MSGEAWPLVCSRFFAGTEALHGQATAKVLGGAALESGRHLSSSLAAEAAAQLAKKAAESALQAVTTEFFRKWTGVKHPDFHSVDLETCKVVLSFYVAREHKAMGSVTRIDQIKVNNREQKLSVTYKERPSFRNVTGLKRLNTWIDRKLAPEGSEGETVTRTEEIGLPEECIADHSSRYFVVNRRNSRQQTRVFAVVLELEFNPGSFIVPRDLRKAEWIDRVLEARKGAPRSEEWQEAEGCVMVVVLQADLRHTPRVEINTGIGTVQFRDPELKHIPKGHLPSACKWADPRQVSVAVRQDRGQDPDEWVVALFMKKALSGVQEEFVIPFDRAVDGPADLRVPAHYL